MTKKEKVLWISPYAPYDGVAHGGGKTHNFYIKYFQKSNKYDITLLSLCFAEERHKLDLMKYGVDAHIACMDKNAIEKGIRIVTSGLAYKNPWNPYGGICLTYERNLINGLLKKYVKTGNVPDIIILQWTFSLMLVKVIKNIFPDATIVGIEEDVTFLNYQRQKRNAKSLLKKIFWEKRYNIMKKIELESIGKVDFVVTNNPKDTNLLLESGVEKKKIFTAAPYIDNYKNVQRKKINKDILFFGAMSRPENYLSAIWFIENVLPLLNDRKVRFVIVGGKPPSILKKYSDQRIIVTGFVENVSEYFERCSCMVAPLIGGAGIKIKVLEALSAGVPVLTNEIGIEGIAAEDKKEYFHCEKPEEYAECINHILDGQLETAEISDCAKRFVQENYNLSEKLDKMMDVIKELSKE